MITHQAKPNIKFHGNKFVYSNPFTKIDEEHEIFSQLEAIITTSPEYISRLHREGKSY